MAEYLEGKHAIAEAIIAGVPIERFMVAVGVKRDEGLESILEFAASHEISVEQVKRADLDALSTVHGAHQGIMAQVHPYEYGGLSDLIDAAKGLDDALIIVLDHIQDPGNLGAVARSAEVVGAVGMLIPNKRAAQVTPQTHKASAGAVSHVLIAREANLPTCLDRLKEEGFWVIGASEKANENIWEAPLEGRIVLVLGAEGTGLSRLVQESCDALASLPQVGRVGSLNVAQAATAISYEWMRRVWDDDSE